MFAHGAHEAFSTQQDRPYLGHGRLCLHLRRPSPDQQNTWCSCSVMGSADFDRALIRRGGSHLRAPGERPRYSVQSILKTNSRGNLSPRRPCFAQPFGLFRQANKFRGISRPSRGSAFDRGSAYGQTLTRSNRQAAGQWLPGCTRPYRTIFSVF